MILLSHFQKQPRFEIKIVISMTFLPVYVKAVKGFPPRDPILSLFSVSGVVLPLITFPFLVSSSFALVDGGLLFALPILNKRCLRLGP